MPLHIIHDDITAVKAEAIVNSVSPQPVVGRGVDAAIHNAAGPSLLEERKRIGKIAVGDAVATSPGLLDARVVIHTAVPLWRDGGCGEYEDVRRCYANSLRAAVGAGCMSVAFPLLACGTYGFPRDQALSAGTEAIRDFLAKCDIDVYWVVKDLRAFRLPPVLHNKVKAYLDDRLLVRAQGSPKRRKHCPRCGTANNAHARTCIVCGTDLALVRAQAASEDEAASLIKLPNPLAEPDEDEPDFPNALSAWLESSTETEGSLARQANIGRKRFARLFMGGKEHVTKGEALGLAVALQMNPEEAADFIGSGGFALSRTNKADLIVKYFLEQERWDVLLVNEVLFAFGQPQLGE